jgi:hypothetical protein
VSVNLGLHDVANGVVSAQSGVHSCGNSEMFAEDSFVAVKSTEALDY